MPEPSPGELVADARSAQKATAEGSSATIDGQVARPGARWISAWITTFLAISAALVFGYHLILALGAADTETIESSMICLVARQWTDGPEGLYGPYGANNPLVLIHAPLYYRLAALLAWPATRAGLEPLVAGRIAGRFLSIAAFVLTLTIVARLARLDGASRRAGLWAVFMLAAARPLANTSMTVRPDMLGVAAQTGGVFLLLLALRTEASRKNTASLTFAFALFGLALCIKQHFVAGLAIGVVLLTATKARDHFPKPAIARAFATTLAIVFVYYGVEGVITGGRVFTSCFLVAAEVPRVHPSTWGGVEVVFDNVAVRMIGLLTLGAACVSATIRPKGWKPLVISLGVYLVVLAIAVAVARRTHSEIVAEVASHSVSILYLALAIGVALACLAADRRRLFGNSIDATLWAVLIVEIALMILLCHSSTGAWMNYAVQAIIFACVIVGRALARGVEGSDRVWTLIPAAIASMVLLADDLADIVPDIRSRRDERVATRLLVERLGRPREQLYFDDRPGWNRLLGQRALIHDGWLYPVFEAANMAEPRRLWLRRALVSGPIRVVVTTHREPFVAGVPEPITELGYRPTIEVGGRLFVWKRD